MRASSPFSRTRAPERSTKISEMSIGVEMMSRVPPFASVVFHNVSDLHPEAGRDDARVVERL